MFNMTDAQLLQKGIKIIDGIAGGGKSSLIDKFFRDHNIEYVRFTSTNRLRRDAMERYNMPVKTIAAGLFVNRGTHFYLEEKEVDCENIVIDEILQSDPKAIQWCINHKDNYNIIITTDSKQLLSPESEEHMMEAFNKLRLLPGVIYVNVTKTLRPRDKKTAILYDKFYSVADTAMMFNAKDLMTTFKNVINYKDMPYSPNDAYITHDNLTEDFLYKDKSFTSNPDLDLIPKGFLSSRIPKDIRSYPILSQLEAEKTHATSYTQVMNVGSAVRFQGSEVHTGQKLYYLIQPTSSVSARELYTVITRMWNIDSFVIVIIDTPKPFMLKTFKGLPVKTLRYLTIDEDGDTEVLSDNDIDDICKQYDTDTIYYSRDEIRSNKGHYKYVRKNANREATDIKRKSSAGSLARRDGKLNYTYMDKVYSILDKHGVTQTRCIHRTGAHTKGKYELDVFSAHPTMLKFEKMPIDGFIETDHPHDDMLNFYLYKGEGHNLTNNSVITDDLAKYIKDNNLGDLEYLFSTPYTVGTFPGDWLYAKAHDTIESKQEIKSIHYGYYQKTYLKLSLKGDCYVRYEQHIYELLICQIFSQLLYYMLQLFDALNGTSIIIDAVDFMCYDDSIQEVINSILPDYIDYRVKEEGKVIYQTYKNLPTKAQKRNKQNKDWYNNLDEDKKEERRRKKREYEQKRRAKLKAEKGAKNHE